MSKSSNHQQRSLPTSSLNNQDNSATSISIEDDKFAIFERWLRINGAQFPMLELREYDTSPTTAAKVNDVVNFSTSEENVAEEKKDSGPDSEQKGVARLHITDTSPSSLSQLAVEDDGSKEMRGVHATQYIPPQTKCVSIPKSCLITVEMGQSTPIGRQILLSDLELDAPKHIYLMIYLLYDKKINGIKSFYAPYYNILPTTLRNMPIFWTKDELELLKGSHIVNQINDRITAINEDYNNILSVIPEFSNIATRQEFQWARMIVCSRNFGLLINGVRTSALVPYSDMLNHLRPRETKWTFDDNTQCFTITTLGKGIKCGSQVYDSYGQKCNHRFLLNYGFCVENNVEIDGFCPNEVPFELGLDLVNGRNRRDREVVNEEEEDDKDAERECWEKKIAFWCRGDPGMGLSSYHYLYGEGAVGSGGGEGVSASSSGEGLQSAATATSTSPSSTSTNIMQTMARMADASTTAALTEARRLSHPIICPSKRIRVCVSNNENTRILFSMLRVLSCNLAEINRISLGGRLSSGGLPLTTTTAAQRLFGIPASVSGSSTSSLRTCRDIRYPINLRNERKAMELLLDITACSLSKYPTSLAQDNADLNDEVAYPKYSNRRNAKLQVRGEKEVLHHFSLWARSSIHVIDIISHELEIEKEMLVNASLSSMVRSASDGRSVEVDTNGVIAPPQNEELGYDYLIQAMEDDDDCHTTILRYCSDVLGAVRRDELNRIAAQNVVG